MGQNGHGWGLSDSCATSSKVCHIAERFRTHQITIGRLILA